MTESQTLYEEHAELTKEKAILVEALLNKMEETIKLEKAIETINANLSKMNAVLKKECFGLNSREQEFYQLRFVEMSRELTLDDIAEKMCLSRGYVGKISMRVSRKLHKTP